MHEKSDSLKFRSILFVNTLTRIVTGFIDIGLPECLLIYYIRHAECPNFQQSCMMSQRICFATAIICSRQCSRVWMQLKVTIHNFGQMMCVSIIESHLGTVSKEISLKLSKPAVLTKWALLFICVCCRNVIVSAHDFFSPSWLKWLVLSLLPAFNCYTFRGSK